MSNTTNKTLLKIFLEHNTTQMDFAFQCNKHKKDINQWLRNRHELKFSKLEELCKEIGYKIEIKYIKL